MILRYMSIVYLPYSRCINIRVGLFIISINHVLLVYIEIHWGLLVELSCNLHKILHL